MMPQTFTVATINAMITDTSLRVHVVTLTTQYCLVIVLSARLLDKAYFYYQRSD